LADVVSLVSQGMGVARTGGAWPFSHGEHGFYSAGLRHHFGLPVENRRPRQSRTGLIVSSRAMQTAAKQPKVVGQKKSYS
jgi:hypothetical protein